MKIVIDIDDIIYKDAVNSKVLFDKYVSEVAIAIILGTPLPEHHGRLIDADALQTEMEKDVRKAMSFVDLKDFVWLAPTIIEGSDSK